jgi:hypothetical protein
VPNREGKTLSDETVRCLRDAIDCHRSALRAHKRALKHHLEGIRTVERLLSRHGIPGHEPDAEGEDGDSQWIQGSGGDQEAGSRALEHLGYKLDVIILGLKSLKEER